MSPAAAPRHIRDCVLGAFGIRRKVCPELCARGRVEIARKHMEAFTKGLRPDGEVILEATGNAMDVAEVLGSATLNAAPYAPARRWRP